MKVFSYVLFFLTQHFRYLLTNNQCKDLTEHSLDWKWVVEMSCTIQWSNVPRLKGFKDLVFFIQPLCVLNTKPILHNQSVKQNLLLSGYSYMILHHFLYSVGRSCIVFGAQMKIWDFFGIYNHHWLWNDTKVKKTVIIVEIWICLKTLLKMLFVMFSIAEPKPTFGPEEQYISGVCNYLLLTMCHVYHCVIRVSSHYLKMSQGQTVGYW